MTFTLTLILIGDTNVGKSNIAAKYTGRDDDDIISTVGVDFLIKNLSIDNRLIKVHIWDTAGQERFRAITQSYYKSISGAIIVFDITDKTSFDNVNLWYNEIQYKAPPDIPIILIGNKQDLDQDRQINCNLANEFALQHNMSYFETSIHNLSSIDLAFTDIITKTYPKCLHQKIDSCKPIIDIDVENKETNSCFCFI